MQDLLSNLPWHTLTGPHARYSAGTAVARRFARGFSGIVGFADAARPDFAELTPHCDADEQFYCLGWSGAVNGGWRIVAEGAICLMLAPELAGQDAADAPLDEPPADRQPGIVPLGAAHVAQAMELAVLTKPGPFGPRTIELGEYFGCFDAGGRLIAMAGERMWAGTLREVSGICTHPDAQGRGLASRLTRHVMARQRRRGERSFLHVMSSNTAARQLYARLGFVQHHEGVVRIVAPPAA